MDLYYFSSGPRERVLKAIVQAGHRVREVITTDPVRSPKVQPTLGYARERQIQVKVVTKRELTTLGQSLEKLVFFSAGFAYLFPESLIQAGRICLNVHGTLLPHYGGSRTLNWIIQNGETHSGITVHRIDTGMDTGPILLQETFDLSPFETGKSLYRKTLEKEPAVVVKALALYESGQATFKPQDPTGVPQYPNRIPEHSELDPSLPLATLFNQIRAADPMDYPAYFYHEGEKVHLKLWRPNKPPEESDLI